MFAQQTIEDVGKFFTILLGVDICLNPVYIKVSGQYCISTISKYVVIMFAGEDGYNCGVHVLHNIQILAEV